MANFFDQFDAPQQQGGNFFDQFDQPTAQAKPPLGQSPFRGGVRGERTLAGDAVAPKVTPKPVNEILGDYGSIAKGAAIGAASGVPGIIGDVESLGRVPLSLLGVSRESAFPTSERVGDYLFGEPSNELEAGSRIAGGFASPGLYAKGLKAMDRAGGFVAQQGVGMTAGSGGAAMEGAYQAGRTGGPQSAAFLEHMRRGPAVSGDAVRMARDAVEELRIQRAEAYKQGIGSTIQGDPAVLNFAPIDQAIRNVSGVGTFQGKSLSSGGDRVWKAIENVVDDWRQSDPAIFHTAEGLDALKKKIGNLAYEEELKTIAGPNTPGSVIVEGVYNAIKQQIVQQAPGYARVMKDYMAATDELREIEKAFSLGRNSTTDSALRKLQSIFRNNANTNYGARVESGQRLNDVGSGELMPALAGQALNSATPRALQGVVGTGIGLGSFATGGLPALASALPALALTSPRLMGEAAFALGNARRVGGNLANTLQNAVIPGGAAGVPSIAGISPQMLSLMTPQMLAQLLAAQAPARQ